MSTVGSVFDSFSLWLFVACCYVSSIILMPLVSAQQLAITEETALNCPPLIDYWPCSCSLASTARTLSLNCKNQQLNDTEADRILGAFTSPLVSPLSVLDLSNNLLTIVPRLISSSSFPQLSYVLMSANNIQSIGSDSFSNFALLKFLDLSDNQITNIQFGAFKGSYTGNGAQMILWGNHLTRIEAEVFRSVLEQMMAWNDGGYPYEYTFIYDNPIDCESDPCHLAWLTRDNPQLMKALPYAMCSNGIHLNEIDSAVFSNCPTWSTPLVESSGPFAVQTIPTSPSVACKAVLPFCPIDSGIIPISTTACNVETYHLCINGIPFFIGQETRDDSQKFVTRFLCPSPYGNYQNPSSSSSYYSCSNYIPYLMNCPAGDLVFNSLSGICDYPLE